MGRHDTQEATDNQMLAQTLRPASWFATIGGSAIYLMTFLPVFWSLGHDVLPGAQPLFSHRIGAWGFGIMFVAIGALSIRQMRRRIPEELHWPVALIPHFAVLGGVVLFFYGFFL